MKEYIENFKKKMKAAHQEKQKKDDIDFVRCFVEYTCPFCGFDAVMTISQHMEDENYEVRRFRSVCVGCGKIWILEFNQKNGVLKVHEMEKSELPNPDDII